MKETFKEYDSRQIKIRRIRSHQQQTRKLSQGVSICLRTAPRSMAYGILLIWRRFIHSHLTSFSVLKGLTDSVLGHWGWTRLTIRASSRLRLASSLRRRMIAAWAMTIWSWTWSMIDCFINIKVFFWRRCDCGWLSFVWGQAHYCIANK